MANKHITTNILIGFLTVLMIGLGLNYWLRPWWKQWEAQQATAEVIQPRQTDAEADQLKNALTASLSDRRKLSQLLWVGVTVVATPAANTTLSATASASVQAVTTLSFDAATQQWLEAEQPGFIEILGRQSPSAGLPATVTRTQYQQAQEQLAKLTADWTWQPLLSVWPTSSGKTAIAGEGAVTFPSMAELCEGQETVEPKVVNAATQLAALKTTVVVGPIVDLGTSGYQGGRMCSDLQKTTEAAARYIENVGAETILPVVGHFPGLGNATADPKTAPYTLTTTVTDLKPFQQLFKKYLNVGVLVSPVKIAGKFDDQPCSQSPECLASFKAEYPKVMVLADGVDSKGALSSSSVATAAGGASSSAALAESMRLSLLAGSDVLILEKPNNWQALTQALDILEQQVRQNPLLKQAVDRAWAKLAALRTVPTQ